MGDFAGVGWQILVSLAAVAAVYGGIRADIRHMHQAIKEAKESASEAHQRIDAAMSCGAGCKNPMVRGVKKQWE